MKEKNNISKIVRILIGTISIVLIVISMSLYSQPFSGCDETEAGIIMLGCVSWQYFGLGLAIVFIFWVVNPKYWYLKYWGLSFVILLALLGGPPALSNGAHISMWNNPSIMFFYWREYGVAILFGGIVGIIFLFFLMKWLDLNNNIVYES